MKSYAIIAGGRLFRLLDDVLVAVELGPDFRLGVDLAVTFRDGTWLVDALR